MSLLFSSRRDVLLGLALAISVGVVAAPSTAFGQAAAGAGDAPVGPPNVDARLALLGENIERVRFVMGKPRNEQPEIAVTGAAPREVFFQAITMFRKANRLSFELTREMAPPLVIAVEDDVHPEHVLAVVDAALERIRHVESKLGIETETMEPPPDASKTPTDVFRAIVQANRQLNLLLEKRFAPADVYQQLTLAIGYAARLRARFPGDRIPEAPPLLVGQQPRDVYRRLIDCYFIIRNIAERLGLDILEFDTDRSRSDDPTPSDVYDIASLLVSELAYIYAQLDGSRPPRDVYYPGRKFPSDVYQRAGILEKQLLELRDLLDNRPDGLEELRTSR